MQGGRWLANTKQAIGSREETKIMKVTTYQAIVENG
jgi:hypothetical protein